MKTIVFSHLEGYLEGIAYPIHKEKIVRYAKMHHVPEDVLEVLYLLPEREYVDLIDIREGLLTIVPAPVDDGVPKKTLEQMAQEREDELQRMKHVVNLKEFTKMGDEEDHESV